MAQISGVVVDLHDRVYVADVLRRDVLRFDVANGTAITIGREGRGPGEFVVPAFPAVSDDGLLYVYDPPLRRVTVFDSLGTYVSDFAVPIPIQSPWGMVIDDEGALYISGVALSGPQAEYVVHKIGPHGEWVTSFGERNPAWRDLGSVGFGDGGPIWWDDGRRSLWFSRGGPDLEISEFTPDGVLRKTIRLSRPIVTDWRPTTTIETHGGIVVNRPRRRLGSVALFGLGHAYIVNSAALVEEGAFRYDVFSRDGSYVASWVERRQDRIGFGDGGWTVYGVITDDPMLMRYEVSFPASQDRRRR